MDDPSPRETPINTGDFDEKVKGEGGYTIGRLMPFIFW